MDKYSISFDNNQESNNVMSLEVAIVQAVEISTVYP